MTTVDGRGTAGPEVPVTDSFHLRVHPSVIFKLGEDLITDDIQALVELVKNAYDADASNAKVTINTRVWTDAVTGQTVSPPAPSSPVVDAKRIPTPRDPKQSDSPSSEGTLQGEIIIADNGDGMTREDIRRGWLTISGSQKRQMKDAKVVTRKKRTPLGDKGLGRLGAQRLGDVLDLVTVPRDGASAFKITIPWSVFGTVTALDEVDLVLREEPRGDMPSGSTLRIRGLRDIERWTGQELRDLQQQLSTMISPFGDLGFDVTLLVDDVPHDLRTLPQNVRDTAELRYQFDYADGVLHVLGRMSVRYLLSGLTAEDVAFRRLTEEDNGVSFLNWLLETQPQKCAAIGLRHGDDRFFSHISQSFTLSDLDNVQRDSERNVADPGPFRGEVDQVGLRDFDAEVFGSVAEYREYVRQINGIRVYRDGFGIRVDADWLRLGDKWTSGKSYYNLRPDNVIGYIELSASHNAALLETTNREGFQDTGAYRNFVLLLDRWRSFTETAQTLIRRSFTEYKSSNLAASARMEPTHTPAQLVKEVTRRVLDSGRQAARVVEIRSTLADVKKAADEILVEQRAAEGSLFGNALQSNVVNRALDRINAATARAEALIVELQTLSTQFEEQRSALELLDRRIGAIQEQLADAWETVALGLTAEALSHEVHQIADRLAGRSQQIIRYLDESGSKDLRVRAYIEHVRSSAAALNRQIAHLNPALKYVRERREDLLISVTLADILDYFNERWSADGISAQLSVDKDFVIKMNRGKLSQVFDNLLLNSEYWIREQQKRGVPRPSRVEIRVRSPYVTVSDTGPGVDPAIEDLIFEPFVTMKARGRGRGLGLFIVRQLLDAEGARIELLDKRDSDGRRRSFNLTFPVIS